MPDLLLRPGLCVILRPRWEVTKGWGGTEGYKRAGKKGEWREENEEWGEGVAPLFLKFVDPLLRMSCFGHRSTHSCVG